MITTASRQTTIHPIVQGYWTSESGESNWGQPSASNYVLTVVDNRLVGMLIGQYPITSPNESAQTLLDSELRAWETASDEALLDFEAGIG